MQSLMQTSCGIGILLLAMIVITEGLKALAGARISQWLADATRSPWDGATTGAINTAILQSSSATTVAEVGFVGAGTPAIRYRRQQIHPEPVPAAEFPRYAGGRARDGTPPLAGRRRFAESAARHREIPAVRTGR